MHTFKLYSGLATAIALAGTALSTPLALPAAVAAAGPDPVADAAPAASSAASDSIYDTDGSPASVETYPNAITLTNIISAVNTTAKIQKEKDLLESFIAKVKKNEPGVLEFQLNLDTSTAQFLTYEKYKNQAAVDHHLNTTYLAKLLSDEDKYQTKRGPNQVYFLNFLIEFIRPQGS